MQMYNTKDSAPIFIGNQKVEVNTPYKVTRKRSKFSQQSPGDSQKKLVNSRPKYKHAVRIQEEYDVHANTLANDKSYAAQNGITQNYNAPGAKQNNYFRSKGNSIQEDELVHNSMSLKYGTSEKSPLTPKYRDELAGSTLTNYKNNKVNINMNKKLLNRPQSALINMNKTKNQRTLIPTNKMGRKGSQNSNHSRFKTISSVKQKQSHIPYRKDSAELLEDQSVDLPNIRDLGPNRQAATHIKQSRRSMDLTSNPRQKTDASYNEMNSQKNESKYSHIDKIHENLQNFQLHEHIRHCIESTQTFQANEIMQQLQKMRNQESFLGQKVEENAVLQLELKKMIQTQRSEIEEKNALIQKHMELQSVLQSTQKKLHEVEYQNLQMQDKLRDHAKIQQEEDKKEQLEIRKLNDQKSAASNDYQKQTQKLNDQVKELMQYNLQLTNNFSQMQNQKQDEIMLAENAQREAKAQVQEKDRQIQSLHQQIQALQSSAKKKGALQDEVKNAQEQHEQFQKQEKLETNQLRQAHEIQLRQMNDEFEKQKRGIVEDYERKLNIQTMASIPNSQNTQQQQKVYRLNEQVKQLQQQNLELTGKQKLQEGHKSQSAGQALKNAQLKLKEQDRNIQILQKENRLLKERYSNPGKIITAQQAKQNIQRKQESIERSLGNTSQQSTLIQQTLQAASEYIANIEEDKAGEQINFRNHSLDLIESKQGQQSPFTFSAEQSAQGSQKHDENQKRAMTESVFRKNKRNAEARDLTPQQDGSEYDNSELKQCQSYLVHQKNFAALLNDSTGQNKPMPNHFQKSRGSNDSKLSALSNRAKSNNSKTIQMASISRLSQVPSHHRLNSSIMSNSRVLQESQSTMIQEAPQTTPQVMIESQKIHQLYAQFQKIKSRHRSFDANVTQLKNDTLQAAATEKVIVNYSNRFMAKHSEPRFDDQRQRELLVPEHSPIINGNMTRNLIEQAKQQEGQLAEQRNVELQAYKTPQTQAPIKSKRISIFDTEYRQDYVQGLYTQTQSPQKNLKREANRHSRPQSNLISRKPQIGGQKMHGRTLSRINVLQSKNLAKNQNEEENIEMKLQDLTQPLKYFMMLKGITTDEFFKEYAKNKIFLLSLVDLQKIFLNLCEFQLSTGELEMVLGEFKQLFFRTEIKRKELHQIINITVKREFDEKLAGANFKTLLETLKKMEQPNYFGQNLAPFEQKTQLISSRTLKTKLFKLKVYTKHQIENMTAYMDKFKTGMIYVKDISSAIEAKYKPRIVIPQKPSPTAQEIQEDQQHPSFYIISPQNKREFKEKEPKQNRFSSQRFSSVDSDDGRFKVDLVDIIPALKTMIDLRKNLVKDDKAGAEQMDFIKYIEKFIIKKIIAVFDVDNNMLMSGDELRPIFEEYMDIYLSDQEARTIDKFFKQKFFRSEIKSKEFTQFLTCKFYVDRNGVSAKRDDILNLKQAEGDFFNVIKPMVTKEKVVTEDHVMCFFGRYMTQNEKKMKKMYLRTFKLAMADTGKFSNERMYNIGAYLDKHENGVIPVQEVTHALLGSWKYKAYAEKAIQEEKPEDPSVLNVHDFFRPLKFHFQKLNPNPVKKTPENATKTQIWQNNKATFQDSNDFISKNDVSKTPPQPAQPCKTCHGEEDPHQKLIDEIWIKYDKDKNYLLSGTELCKMFKNLYELDQILPVEIKMLEAYFRKIHKRPELTKQDLLDLLNKKYVRKWNQAVVDQTQNVLLNLSSRKLGPIFDKMVLVELGKETAKLAKQKPLMKPYDLEQEVKADESINYRLAGINVLRFKKILERDMKLNKLQISNFTDYMDKNNNGFILFEDVKQVVAVIDSDLIDCKGHYDPATPPEAVVEAKEDIPTFFVEDTIQPLKTVLRRKGLQAESLFQKYDADQSYLLSEDQIGKMASDHVNIQMTPNELRQLRQYIRNQFNREHLKRSEFEELLNMRMPNEFSPQEAKKALSLVVGYLQRIKNDLELKQLQKKVRFDKYLIEKIKSYDTKGKKKPFVPPVKLTTSEKNAINREAKFVEDQKKQKGFSVKLGKLGYQDMLESRDDYYVPMAKDEVQNNVQNTSEAKPSQTQSNNSKEVKVEAKAAAPKFMSKKKMQEKLEQEQKAEQDRQREQVRKRIEEQTRREQQKRKQEQQFNVLEIYLKEFFGDPELTEMNVRNFKYAIYRSKIITDDDIEGMTADQAVHNLAMYMNTMDDGFIQMADVIREATAKSILTGAIGKDEDDDDEGR